MAPGPGRSLTALIAAGLLLLVSCDDGSGEATGEATLVAPPNTTTAPLRTTTAPTTTTTLTTTTTTAPAETVPALDPDDLPDLGAQVRVPEGEGRFPSVVLVHGGGWLGGAPSLMSPLAADLTEEGFLTVNAQYHLAGSRSPGFPRALHDVACAVRFAAGHPRSDGSVALVGFSAGAHLGAVVALTGDRYGEGCPIGGSGVPDRFVGLAGPYDVSRLGIAAVPFFGGGPQAVPEAWAAGNPQLHTDANPDLASLLLLAENDGIVDATHAVRFAEALTDSGSEVLVEVVEGARHTDLQDPEVVGDLIVTWLER